MRFPMSLRWSSYVAPKSPKGGLENAKRPICVKKSHSFEESLLQSFFMWKLSAQSCKAFIGLTNCAKIIGGGRPLVPVISHQRGHFDPKLLVQGVAPHQ